ncbi:hypothetical protein AWN76_013610 [Rhodothermaceae bacterium RA]|nr:hypothetical protein AWN76_013610 [Rhodothermaceae bacterium RA]
MTASRIVDRIRDLLQITEPFNRLAEPEREALLADVSVEYFAADEVILEQGTTRVKGLYIVESGLVRLRDVVQQRLISKCTEGQTFGSFGLLKSQGVAVYEATALEPTVCIVLSARRFLELYKTNEEVAAYFDQDVNQYVLRLGTDVDVPGAHLLFGQRLGRLPLRRPPVCAPETPACEAARQIDQAGGGPLVVMDEGRPIGILTDADLRSRLVAAGRPLETPVQALMTTPAVTLSDQASLFEAMMAMLDRRTDALVVVPAEGAMSGEAVRLLTDRDVAHFRGQDPIATVQRIDSVGAVSDLVNIRREVSLLLARLYRQEVPPELLGRFLAALYDRISVRVLHLVEQALASQGLVPPPDVPWVWLRLGSSGRQEMALTSRQHNAVLYVAPAEAEAARHAADWFARLAEDVNRALEACGFAPSPITARESAWRLSLRAWKRQVRSWIFEADAAALQDVLPFFDLRGIYGDLALVDELKADIVDALNVQMLDRERHLPARLADAAAERRGSTSLLRRLVPERFLDNGAPVDLREQGLLPVVDAARILALEARYLTSTNTFDRLRHVSAALPEEARTLDAALEAYQNLTSLRLEHQLRAAEEGEAPTNLLDPAQLTKYQRTFLRNALAAVDDLQDLLTRRFKKKR